ncbi:MAG: hypothetical protein INQ03_04935 [Candidatus Heimdallarchaeota archaeon]|nr:hypothetical protein [Candidatus Heimdallarchaeota archaeon]
MVHHPLHSHRCTLNEIDWWGRKENHCQFITRRITGKKTHLLSLINEYKNDSRVTVSEIQRYWIGALLGKSWQITVTSVSHCDCISCCYACRDIDTIIREIRHSRFSINLFPKIHTQKYPIIVEKILQKGEFDLDKDIDIIELVRYLVYEIHWNSEIRETFLGNFIRFLSSQNDKYNGISYHGLRLLIEINRKKPGFFDAFMNLKEYKKWLIENKDDIGNEFGNTGKRTIDRVESGLNQYLWFYNWSKEYPRLKYNCNSKLEKEQIIKLLTGELKLNDKEDIIDVLGHSIELLRKGDDDLLDSIICFLSEVEIVFPRKASIYYYILFQGLMPHTELIWKILSNEKFWMNFDPMRTRWLHSYVKIVENYFQWE